MPDINVGQTGHSPVGLKSIPKLTKINGDDALKVVYRNMGNNHAYPFVWADTVTVASGATEVVVVSGVKFHGMDVATYGSFSATPKSDPGARFWVEQDTALNVVKIKIGSSAAGAINFAVMCMLGVDPSIETLACRGNTGAAQMLP
jgi:hypothetical protein